MTKLKPTKIADGSPTGCLLSTIIDEFQGSKLNASVYTALVIVFFQRPDVEALREDEPVLWGKIHAAFQEAGDALTGYMSVFDKNPLISGMESMRSMTGAMRLYEKTQQLFDVVGGHVFLIDASVMPFGTKLHRDLHAMGLRVQKLSNEL